jgi:hypothetical protein
MRVYLSTLQFMNDHILIQGSEVKLQHSVYSLNNTGKKYIMKVSTKKKMVWRSKKISS